MKLTPTQTALLALIEKRNNLIEERDTCDRSPEGNTAYWRIVGELDGLDQAIHAFEEIEPIRSLEYLAVKPVAHESDIPLADWKV